MTNILHISTLPGEHAYSGATLDRYLDRFVNDPVALRKLKFIARESGISTKHSVLPDFQEGFEKPLLYKDPKHMPSTSERMEVFAHEAPKLGEAAARLALDAHELNGEDLDAIIAVSCTGMYAPGLEIHLANRLGMKADAQRHAVNFMGCYAAFHGLRLADLICQTNPMAKVLVVCVELCSLHFRNDTGDDNLLSTALFSDGAAAVLLSGSQVNKPAIAQLSALQSQLIPEGEDAMGWFIGDRGFEMVLKRSVPAFVEQQIAQAFQDALQKQGLQKEDVSAFAIHPGGKNILHAFSRALQLEEEQLSPSFDTLDRFGNMSSCTVLFVLDQILSEKQAGRSIYAAAFGPGFTVESALIKSVAR